jgi:hypothetical protein
MRVPFKRQPDPPPLGRGSRVRLLHKDRYLECAYPGKTGTVTHVGGGLVNLILDCGHPFQTRLDWVAPSDTRQCVWCRRTLPTSETQPVPKWHNLPACAVCRGEAPQPVAVSEQHTPDPPRKRKIETPKVRVLRRVKVGRKLRKMIKEGKAVAP